MTSISAAALGFASGAMAQQAAPSATPSADENTGIADIVVTAQRRSERLQDVPVSVTAISADALKDRGLNDASQLTLAAPSMQLGKDNTFTIRGIGTLAFAGTIDSSVATAIDEVNIGRPLASSPIFFDISQVEVLNGPQGLLFGKNASAGLVNIRSTDPVLGKFGGSFDLEGDSRPRPGSDGQGVIARSALNIPVSENSALRIAGVYSYQDPLTQHVGGIGNRYDGALRQYGVRAKYLWEPTDALTIRLQGDYAESHGISGYYDSTYRELADGSIDAAPLAADGVVPSDKNLVHASDAPEYRDLKNGGAQAKVAYVLGNGMELSNIFAWRFYDLDQQIDADSTGQDGANVNHNISSYNQYSNELRLALPAGNRLSGQMGLFWFHSTLNTYLNIAGSNFVPSFLLPTYPFCVGADVSAPCTSSNDYFLGIDKDYTLDTDSYAAFGQLTYELTDKLKLIAGGRVTHDKISIDLAQNQLSYFVPLAITGTFDQSYAHTDFSWRGGAQYNFTRDTMLYASYARGYKGPGFNDTAPVADADLRIKPETSHTLEVGFKGSFLNRHLVIDLSAFHTKFRNYQSQSFDSTLRTFLISNAASLTSKGVEVDVTAKPFEGLTLHGNATLLDAKFGDFPGVQCYAGQGGCSSDGTFNAKGMTAPSSPKFTSTLGARYEHPVGGDLTAFVAGDWYHRSSIYYLVNHAPGAMLDAVDIFGASIGVRGDHWKFSVFCKNCTNKLMPNSIDLESGDQAAGKSSYLQTFGYNSVRTIGVQLGFDF
ncbi:TonB-dependent receptor [Novosphingobium sp. 9]|uniref:TonB-dependent receptor n=1 Tax=Novosphingobium sp. 9 TaxID=2025349 RepID=UPI0021B65D9E|nr:TonB-dependent receptor [Novosphingobium sp. 9]